MLAPSKLAREFLEIMAFAKPIVFGNWKMNGLRSEGLALVGDIAEKAVRPSGTLGVFPPSTLLYLVRQRLAGSAVRVGGQDCHEAEGGAYTGSISAPMLIDCGAEFVILGHSERRHGLRESDELIRRKVGAALSAGLKVVLCIGETESEYKAGERDERLETQLRACVPKEIGIDQLIIAYEPVWAIGTGRTPTLEEVNSTHKLIRQRLADITTEGGEIAILYGGSVKPDNASEILSLTDVDGALVGGSSLKSEDFWAIYTAGGGT